MKKTIYRYLFFTLFQSSLLNCYSQYYEEKPEPEISIGIKVVKGKIIYGPKSFYITDHSSIGLQAKVSYHRPLKIFSLSPYQQRYIDFVLEGGFQFCKAQVFDSVVIDRINNIVIRDHSYNANYLPVYVGLSNRSAFSIGTGIFYWKGLGARDIWGAKFLSIGYNAKRFRFNAAGEWYAQTTNGRHSGTFLSVEFLWKLFVDE
jgi:hypothetical protein